MIAIYGNMQEESWRYATKIGHGRMRQYVMILFVATYKENIIRYGNVSALANLLVVVILTTMLTSRHAAVSKTG